MSANETVKAFTEPKFEHDQLIDHMLARAAEEHARGSDASESAAKVKALLEETGLNSQAYSWGKTILKKIPKKDGQAKAMDVIRSLKAMLPYLEAHVTGQGTLEMPFDDDEADAVEPLDDDEDVDTSNVRPIDFGGEDEAAAG